MDLYTDLKEFALSLPYSVQQPLRYIYGAIPLPVRLGKVFRETYALLQESQWWSRERLEKYQIQQVSKLLHHAYENVPYYRNVFDERGLKPQDIQNLDDLRKLPYLTKEIIRNNLTNMVASNYPKSRLKYVTTGGTSGIPLGFYTERGMAETREWAFILTQWARVGIKPDDKSIVLRGNIISSASKGKFWEYKPVEKSLIMSSYHLTDKNLPKYIEKIREFKPDFIQAYPSAITILARFMKEHNIAPFTTVKATVHVSENLYPAQRQLLEETFQCRVFDFYGHSEQAVMAGWCEKSTYYHIFSEYGVVELVDRDGNRVNGEDEMGEIVATGFNTYAMPFIRYKTGDLATNTNAKCECGRNYSLFKSVDGRLREFIVTNEGSLIPFSTPLFEIHDWSKVRQIQFLQDVPGEIVLLVVRDPTYSVNEIQEYVLRLFKERLGGQVNLKVECVDHIPLTERGKYRYLIQKLPVDFADYSNRE